MSVRRNNVNKVTTTNAALTILLGREVGNRFVAALAGSTVEGTRYRGGCWKVSGTPVAVNALKARLQKANSRVLHPKVAVCKVVRRPPMVPEVLREEVYHSRPVILTQHYSTCGPRFVAYAPSWGTFVAHTCTGTDAEEVWDRLTDRLPVVVKESTFRGRPVEVLRAYDRKRDQQQYIAESEGVRRRAETSREAEKALISALGGGRPKRATYHKAPRVGTYQGREWKDEGSLGHNPFSDLG